MGLSSSRWAGTDLWHFLSQAVRVCPQGVLLNTFAHFPATVQDCPSLYSGLMAEASTLAGRRLIGRLGLARALPDSQAAFLPGPHPQGTDQPWAPWESTGPCRFTSPALPLWSLRIRGRATNPESITSGHSLSSAAAATQHSQAGLQDGGTGGRENPAPRPLCHAPWPKRAHRRLAHPLPALPGPQAWASRGASHGTPGRHSVLPSLAGRVLLLPGSAAAADKLIPGPGRCARVGLRPAGRNPPPEGWLAGVLLCPGRLCSP